MLYIRLARENDRPGIIRQLFSFDAIADHCVEWSEALGIPADQSPESIDSEKIALDLDLTYREAMDLRWAIEVAREYKRGSATSVSPAPLPLPKLRHPPFRPQNS